MEDEIALLENELRIQLPREIAKARAHGDLSENAEYHAAKERQGMVNARLGQLRARLRELSMVDFSRIPRDRVGLGSSVKVLDLTKEEEMTYKLRDQRTSRCRKGPNFYHLAHRAGVARQEGGRYREGPDPWGHPRNGDFAINYDA